MPDGMRADYFLEHRKEFLGSCCCIFGHDDIDARSREWLVESIDKGVCQKSNSELCNFQSVSRVPSNSKG